MYVLGLLRVGSIIEDEMSDLAMKCRREPSKYKDDMKFGEGQVGCWNIEN
jgi:hypothetical protein